jgi:DNA-directed RNA polymerase subunit M/transcription elongation factor TFIIS
MTFIIQSPDTFRKQVVLRLKQKFPSECLTHVNNIEKSVFNYALKEATLQKIVKKWENPFFVQLYLNRLRSVYLNLDAFIKMLIAGEIQAKDVGFMTHQEIQPDKWMMLIENKIIRNASKYNNNIEASTDMFTCKKCKSKKCTYYELQTRSADEPATIFITCLDCGKHWKM